MTPSKRRRQCSSACRAIDDASCEIAADLGAAGAEILWGAATAGPTRGERRDATEACRRAIRRLERLVARIERLECDPMGGRPMNSAPWR